MELPGGSLHVTSSALPDGSHIETESGVSGLSEGVQCLSVRQATSRSEPRNHVAFGTLRRQRETNTAKGKAEKSKATHSDSQALDSQVVR